jgi:hypothetical protein
VLSGLALRDTQYAIFLTGVKRDIAAMASAGDEDIQLSKFAWGRGLQL